MKSLTTKPRDDEIRFQGSIKCLRHFFFSQQQWRSRKPPSIEPRPKSGQEQTLSPLPYLFPPMSPSMVQCILSCRERERDELKEQEGKTKRCEHKSKVISTTLRKSSVVINKVVYLGPRQVMERVLRAGFTRK